MTFDELEAKVDADWRDLMARIQTEWDLVTEPPAQKRHRRWRAATRTSDRPSAGLDLLIPITTRRVP